MNEQFEVCGACLKCGAPIMADPVAIKKGTAQAKYTCVCPRSGPSEHEQAPGTKPLLG